MKRQVLLLISVLFTSYLFAQAPQVPDFKDQPMIINSDGSLKKLEKQSSEMKTKMVPYVGVTRFISIEGGKSPVRAKTDVSFIIKCAEDVDPETLFYCSKTVGAGKKNREIDLEKTSAYAGYGAKGKSVKKNYVKLNFDKISAGVYKITCEGLEHNTEYGFVPVAQGSTGAQSTLFLFGID